MSEEKKPPETFEDKARALLAKIRADREAYISQVNQNITAMNGAIEALELLLAPPTEAETPTPPTP